MNVLSNVERDLLSRCETLDDFEKTSCLYVLGVIQVSKKDIELRCNCIEEVNGEIDRIFDDGRVMYIQKDYTEYTNRLLNTENTASWKWWAKFVLLEMLGALLVLITLFSLTVFNHIH